MTSDARIHAQFAGSRSRTLFAAAAAIAVTGFAAAQTPQMTLNAASVNSDGRQWPHSSSVSNGVLSQANSGSSFQLGAVKIFGTASKVAGSLSQNFSGEMRIMVRNVTKGASYTSYNIFNNFNLPWTTATATGKTFDGSSVGTIDPGDQIEVRFFETYDNSGAPDSTWSGVTVQLFRKPPTATGYTALNLIACPCTPIGDGGSDNLLMIAIFDQDGDLIDSDDGGAPGGLSLSLDGLPPGEYYLAVTNQGGAFDNGFVVTPGGGGVADGVVRLSYEGALIVEAGMHDDDVLWRGISLYHTACEADFDGDGSVGLSDLTLLLSVYGAACP